ncbi:MAG: Ig-like domain-containing protein [Bacilli bacterium]|nr:Ig-like domain-containing protein [Bacilli bacterium]
MKKIIYLLMFLLVGIIISGCNPVVDGEVIITVDDYTISVNVGESQTVNPIVTGLEGTVALNYTSSDETIFTVEDGVIQGLEVGVATLNISVVGSDASANVSVTVVDPAQSNDEITEIAVLASKTKLNVNESIKLNVFANSSVYTGEVQWFSNNTSVATVDASGLVSALKSGSVTITALVGTVWDTVNITVQTSTSVVVPSITSIILSGSSFVNVNGAVMLTVTTNTGEAPDLIWSSSDAGVASVSEGVITGVSAGIATITATLEDNLTVSGTFTILVRAVESGDSSISTISLTAPNEVLAGNKIKLNVSWVPSTESASFTYSSSNEAVATVDSAGWVTGVAGGVVQIIATLQSDSTKSAVHTISVIPLPEGLIITGATSMSYGQNISLQVQAYPVGSSAAVTWESSNTSVATVDSNGRVTGIAAGSATITATSVVSSVIKSSHSVTVTDAKSITLNPTTVSLMVGATQTISAVVNSSSLTDKTIIWTSSNASVATVDSNGKVTAVAAGSATIIAKLSADNTVQSQVAVNVTAQTTPTISLSATSASLTVGASKTITATVSNTTNTSVTWTSSNTSVATVSGGLVMAKGAGSAIITATSVANTSVKATCSVTVTAPTSGGTLTVTADPSASIKVGATGYQLYLKDSSGVAVSRTECTFTSSASSIATVSTYGTISALKAGTAKITVTHPTKGSGTITLTITGTTVPTPTGLVVTQSPTGSIAVGASGYQLYVSDSSGSSVSRTECTFKTSASAIATVSTYGTISALSGGTAKITVTHPTKGTGTITLTINGPTGVVENKRNTIIQTALNEVGYVEGYNNNTKYGAWYPMNYQPWCAMFVSWCAYKSGIPTSIVYKYASVALGLDWYRNKGSAYYKTYYQTQTGAYVPRCGDIVFFKSGGASHTGLVIKCVGNKMYTVEGNTSDKVALRYYYFKSYSKITGYGIPAYPASSTPIKNFSVTGATYGGGSSTT